MDRQLVCRCVVARSLSDQRIQRAVGDCGVSQSLGEDVGHDAQDPQLVRRDRRTVSLIQRSDGIEIDWEQAGCSTSAGTPSDTANFVAFTQALRSAVGSKPLLTAAVPVAGLPQKISLAKAVGTKALNCASRCSLAIGHADVAVMNVMNCAFDHAGMTELADDNAAPGWSTLTGANSALRECAPTGGNAGSAALALSTYSKMGVPASSLTLGVR